MTELIKPVRYGILIGLFGIIFGIGWAFWLVLGHERVHKSLENRAVKEKSEQGIVRILEPKDVHAHSDEKHSDERQGHDEGKINMPVTQSPHFEGRHDNPIFELSHTRLRRGHLHAMGLGIFTIVISLVIAFTSAPDKIKTIASILAGLGGIIYPFAWILMGYRTPSLGPSGAEASVTTIAGPGVLLVLIGISTAIIFLLKDIFRKK